jgi:hypothetical protein
VAVVRSEPTPDLRPGAPFGYRPRVIDSSEPGSGGPIGRTRLGNPPNGDAPKPRGACRVLMIGDMIGKPGPVAVEQLLPELRDARQIDKSIGSEPRSS